MHTQTLRELGENPMNGISMSRSSPSDANPDAYPALPQSGTGQASQQQVLQH